MNPVKQLSIITPTWNSAATLPATLASIRPLFEAGAEHIVVDSGSEDGTQELAETAGSRVLYCPPGSMYAAINEGLKAAKGEWLTYINSDDILYADAVAEMLNRVLPDSDFIYGNIDYIDEVNRFLFYWRCPASRFLKLATSCYGGLFQQGTLFRRTVLESLEGFDENYKYCADTDFFLRALDGGFRFQKYTSKSVGAFRLLPTQFSQTRGKEMAAEGRLIRDRYWKGKSVLGRTVSRGCAFGLRNFYNVDSRIVRSLKSRGLDKR